MKDLLRYWFFLAVEYTERHFDGLWQLFIASAVVFAGLCYFILSNN